MAKKESISKFQQEVSRITEQLSSTTAENLGIPAGITSQYETILKTLSDIGDFKKHIQTLSTEQLSTLKSVADATQKIQDKNSSLATSAEKIVKLAEKELTVRSLQVSKTKVREKILESIHEKGAKSLKQRKDELVTLMKNAEIAKTIGGITKKEKKQQQDKILAAKKELKIIGDIKGSESVRSKIAAGLKGKMAEVKGELASMGVKSTKDLKGKEKALATIGNVGKITAGIAGALAKAIPNAFSKMEALASQNAISVFSEAFGSLGFVGQIAAVLLGSMVEVLKRSSEAYRASVTMMVRSGESLESNITGVANAGREAFMHSIEVVRKKAKMSYSEISTIMSQLRGISDEVADGLKGMGEMGADAAREQISTTLQLAKIYGLNAGQINQLNRQTKDLGATFDYVGDRFNKTFKETRGIAKDLGLDVAEVTNKMVGLGVSLRSVRVSFGDTLSLATMFSKELDKPNSVLKKMGYTSKDLEDTTKKTAGAVGEMSDVKLGYLAKRFGGGEFKGMDVLGAGMTMKYGAGFTEALRGPSGGAGFLDKLGTAFSKTTGAQPFKLWQQVLKAVETQTKGQKNGNMRFKEMVKLIQYYTNVSERTAEYVLKQSDQLRNLARMSEEERRDFNRRMNAEKDEAANIAKTADAMTSIKDHLAIIKEAATTLVGNLMFGLFALLNEIFVAIKGGVWRDEADKTAIKEATKKRKEIFSTVITEFDTIFRGIQGIAKQGGVGGGSIERTRKNVVKVLGPLSNVKDEIDEQEIEKNKYRKKAYDVLLRGASVRSFIDSMIEPSATKAIRLAAEQDMIKDQKKWLDRWNKIREEDCELTLAKAKASFWKEFNEAISNETTPVGKK